jgi:hypothetical protein
MFSAYPRETGQVLDRMFEMSVAEQSLKLIGLFESELLLHLMLCHWNHPLADDADFRNDLLETAAEVLRASLQGQKLIDNLPPPEMNLVAALWYAELVQLSESDSPDDEQITQRKEWVNQLRKAVPSCFCASDRLF